ncbi:HNH endonuclease [Salinadaptatus halalkaliphilus]|uniref:HNH endonuclease n=1 Tax=Salinadaptatus halalkaliphilus TaxID=2419781 RepID=A0A4S3TL33_9EURY|nr:HNH endonuclease [Salinadaptatus halalkaliphilus]THE63308.1 HNH endonuclease [Salinadaptatus halalkaliphilus]
MGRRDEDGIDDARADSRGYGDGWDELRRATLRRDGYACTRCGADDRTLQAHHVVPRGAGGPDELENLLTLCRPCHGVIHQSNRSFDDVRDEAPLFPNREAPEAVARMRTPDDQWCSRCGHEFEPSDLVAWNDVPPATESTSVADTEYDHLTLCEPCAGLLLECLPACHLDSLSSNHGLSTAALADRRQEAPVRSSVFASPPVSVRREPRSVRERVIDDTPIRFLTNHRGIRLATGTVALYLAVMIVLTAI